MKLPTIFGDSCTVRIIEGTDGTPIKIIVETRDDEIRLVNIHRKHIDSRDEYCANIWI